MSTSTRQDSVILTVSEIGRAGQPDATDRSQHASIIAARVSLINRFGLNSIRGGDISGTIGSLNGRVFQASRTWSIQ